MLDKDRQKVQNKIVEVNLNILIAINIIRPNFQF